MLGSKLIHVSKGALYRFLVNTGSENSWTEPQFTYCGLAIDVMNFG